MKERELQRDNLALRKALVDLTTAYVKIIDLFLEVSVSLENVGLSPVKGKGKRNEATQSKWR
jgi:hypothetical protein